ncbi:MAG: hypothetical protein IT384_12860 [Deltaproteobacteria bacterium]|nr:hypothetical protein [Deltaproteobacteria bacterium]
MSEDALVSAIEVIDTALPFDFSRPSSAEAGLREALASAETAGDLGRAIELRTQIARALARQGKLEDAEHTLRSVHKQLPQITDAAPKLRYLLELGRVLTSKRTPSEARPLFLEAWELASARGEDFFAVDAAQMMAVIESPKQRFAWTQSALAIVQRSSDTRVQAWLGSLHQTAGWHFFHLQQLEKALESFTRALEHLGPDSTSKATIAARCSIARTLRALHRTEEALAIQRELLIELKRVRAEDGIVYEELAECLHTLRRDDEARAYFAVAYEQLSKNEWLVDNQPARLNRLKKLGKETGPRELD